MTLQDAHIPGVIHSWSYEDKGSSLAVGSVIPEASHSMLIALGLSATALHRRRESKIAQRLKLLGVQFTGLPHFFEAIFKAISMGSPVVLAIGRNLRS